MFEYAQELGIEIVLGKRVEGYFEDEQKAGIILQDGERVGPVLH